MERKEEIKIILENWPEASYTRLREALETLIPELKESEDEKARKWLTNLVENLGDAADEDAEKELEVMRPLALAYLERQKEQKPLSTEETELNSLAFLEQMGYTCVPPGKEQKPAEWDEKDEKVYDYLKSGFEYASNNPNLLNSVLSGASDATIQDYRNFIDKLKILRPQPKLEWSEDKDFEDCLTELACELYEQRDDSPENTAFKENEILKKWTPILLKKARRKVDWSEEDEENMELVIDCIYNFYPDPVIKYKLKDWLKSLRPQWRPSEEHLNALLAVFNDPNNISSQTCQLALTDLYEQLKKL